MTSKFQQRHSEAMATMMQSLRPDSAGSEAMRDEVIRAMSDMFAADNQLFDRGHFERACMAGANVRKRVA